MGIGQYTLAEDGRTPIPCNDTIAWGQWMNDPQKRIVSQEAVGKYWISTVFLALDHSFGSGPPVLWETMVFNRNSEHPWEDVECERYSDFDSACRGHNELVAEYRAKQDD